jgi:hypothetical protein
VCSEVYSKVYSEVYSEVYGFQPKNFEKRNSKEIFLDLNKFKMKIVATYYIN